MFNYLLTTIIFFPLLGSILLLFVKKENEVLAKGLGLFISGATFILSLFLYFGFREHIPDMQYAHYFKWIPSLNIYYSVGVDGLSLMMVMLTTFLTPIALLSSWESITKKVKEYTIMMLLLEVGMLGVFSALDTFLFYIFWEAMLIPMYFIIGIWGGSDRVYAAVKFFLYTMAGSLLMLVAIIWLGYYASTQPGGEFTTDLTILYRIAPSIPAAIQLWMFAAFTLSFAIKVPLFPFHTWLPDAHVQAPTAGSVILAGVLLKMGTYGLLRFSFPLFPHAAEVFVPYLATLAVVGIIYGALVSMVQTDMKKLVAYSSVSHLGFVVLGICALTEEGVQGAIIQMVNHGLSTGALFLLVGMIYDRRHTREIAEFGGIAKVMPVFATVLFIVSLSSAGLPGLNGFIGEFLILLGSFSSEYMSKWFAILGASGVIFAAVYLLWMYQRVAFGNITNDHNKKLLDLNWREVGLLVPVLLFIVWIGVYPNTFLTKSAQATKSVVSLVRGYTLPAVASQQQNPPQVSSK